MEVLSDMAMMAIMTLMLMNMVTLMQMEMVPVLIFIMLVIISFLKTREEYLQVCVLQLNSSLILVDFLNCL